MPKIKGIPNSVTDFWIMWYHANCRPYNLFFFRKKSGKSAYCIPVGGSSGVGVFGYIEAWEELITRQNVMKKYDDIVVACGSGGTIAGLAIGNYLTGEKLK